MAAHTFRFFVSDVGSVGGRLSLDDDDVAHVRVLRGAPGATVEVVDAAGAVWRAALHDGAFVTLLELAPARARLPEVVLYAGMLSGQRWDQLVDGAVQAGASRIVPVVASAREGTKASARIERSARVSRAAAKQAKRLHVPEVGAPVTYEHLHALEPGVVLTTDAARALNDFSSVPRGEREAAVPLLIGGAEGLDADLVANLEGAGWQRAGLGDTVLRSELAAAIGVAGLVQVLQREGRAKVDGR